MSARIRTRGFSTRSRSQAQHIAGMRLKVGVMGGAGPDNTATRLRKAFALGRAIARHDCILITGACPGFPLAASDGARAEGGFVIGISPGLSLDEHVQKYGSPAEGHDALIYTGSGLMGREVVNIRSSDVVVIVGGSSGTLGELAIAYDEGKLIGVLQGTGGITGLVPDIIRACNKNTGARILYDADPGRLVARLVREYEARHYKRPSCFSDSKGKEAKPGLRTVRDFVCGMWINPSTSKSNVVFEGKRYFFCCSRCADMFRRAPTPYLQIHWSVSALKGEGS